ncbi:hypothetical protein KUF71_025490 [Frankliniella fusca]|uniref:Reverse transcriptase n=1 Tax=Frankliniella fusca TaxID=407009 RepID=A0AAE1H9F1_9NEOP|nr:hypothetical protein KUF71_025490 [Frankliniella fusca]
MYSIVKYLKRKALDEFDRNCKRVVKDIMNLPRRASPEVVFIPSHRGGANIPPLSDLADVGSTVRAFKMLTCPDPVVREVAEASLRHVVAPVLEQKQPTQDQLCTYLFGEATSKYSRGTTIWSAARSAARRLAAKIPGLQWLWSEEKLWSLSIPMPERAPNRTIVDQASRGDLHHYLRLGQQHKYFLQLLAKPDQGKVFDASSLDPASNHFMQSGMFTRFCDWNFVHRARLGVLPLRACVRVANIDRRCRVCRYPEETTAHVLCHCMRHSRAMNNRHRVVIKHLVSCMSDTSKLRIGKTVSGTNSREKPDLVLLDKEKKQAAIIDVACPFENRYEALVTKREEKIHKYSPLADVLRADGYKVDVEAVVVGALGSWDGSNERALALLGIPAKKAKTMKKIIALELITWSRDIYVEHVSRARQLYEEDVVICLDTVASH